MNQPELNLAYGADPVVVRSHLEWRFWRFHRDNPLVYGMLKKLATMWVARHAGRRLGVQMLIERARWEHQFTTTDPEWKLNNSYAAFYARLLMHREEAFANLFEIREQVEGFSYVEPSLRELEDAEGSMAKQRRGRKESA